jgi:hypothetical protein
VAIIREEDFEGEPAFQEHLDEGHADDDPPREMLTELVPDDKCETMIVTDGVVSRGNFQGSSGVFEDWINRVRNALNAQERCPPEESTGADSISSKMPSVGVCEPYSWTASLALRGHELPVRSH